MKTKIFFKLLIGVTCFIISQMIFYFYLDDQITRYLNITPFTSIGLRLITAFIFYLVINLIVFRKIDFYNFDILSILYLLLIISLSFVRGIDNSGLNLNPLTVINDLRTNLNHTAVITIANIFVYLPTGIYFRYRFNLKERYLFLIFLPYIVILEASQLLLNCGICDINDVLTNTLGFILGSRIYYVFFSKKLLRQSII